MSDTNGKIKVSRNGVLWHHHGDGRWHWAQDAHKRDANAHANALGFQPLEPLTEAQRAEYVKCVGGGYLQPITFQARMAEQGDAYVKQARKGAESTPDPFADYVNPALAQMYAEFDGAPITPERADEIIESEAADAADEADAYDAEADAPAPADLVAELAERVNGARARK